MDCTFPSHPPSFNQAGGGHDFTQVGKDEREGSVKRTWSLKNRYSVGRKSGLCSRSTGPYRKHRFPPEIISRGVWFAHRFSLGSREVEEL